MYTQSISLENELKQIHTTIHLKSCDFSFRFAVESSHLVFEYQFSINLFCTDTRGNCSVSTKQIPSHGNRKIPKKELNFEYFGDI